MLGVSFSHSHPKSVTVAGNVRYCSDWHCLKAYWLILVKPSLGNATVIRLGQLKNTPSAIYDIFSGQVKYFRPLLSKAQEPIQLTDEPPVTDSRLEQPLKAWSLMAVSVEPRYIAGTRMSWITPTS